ncbi:hypothetical protein BGP_3304 [Beggiatoa sp. PS]|nr:hypothetical protein BGP_3304 [Beggiatoa sp. PS]
MSHHFDGQHFAILHIYVGTRFSVHLTDVCFIYGLHYLAHPFPACERPYRLFVI